MEGNTQPRGERKPLDLVRDHVPIFDVAGRYTSLDSQGRGKCPIHQGSNPHSFKVYESNFYCFSCGASGSAADIEYECGGGYDSPVFAAVALLLDYGLTDLLEPSEAWKAKQARQKSVRDGLGRVAANVLRRRIFKFCIIPLIETTATPEERDDLVTEAWDEFAQFSDASLVAYYESMKGNFYE